MNRMTIGLMVAAFIAAGAGADDGWTVTGATVDSVVMAAPRARVDFRHVDVWAAQTYEQGAYCKNSIGAVYWTPTGGASATEPSHNAATGTASYDSGAIVWYRIDNSLRKYVIIYADITQADASVLAGKQPLFGGDKLSATLPKQSYPDEQRAVYVKGKGSFYVCLRKD